MALVLSLVSWLGPWTSVPHLTTQGWARPWRLLSAALSLPGLAFCFGRCGQGRACIPSLLLLSLPSAMSCGAVGARNRLRLALARVLLWLLPYPFLHGPSGRMGCGACLLVWSVWAWFFLGGLGLLGFSLKIPGFVSCGLPTLNLAARCRPTRTLLFITTAHKRRTMPLVVLRAVSCTLPLMTLAPWNASLLPTRTHVTFDCPAMPSPQAHRSSAEHGLSAPEWHLPDVPEDLLLALSAATTIDSALLVATDGSALLRKKLRALVWDKGRCREGPWQGKQKWFAKLPDCRFKLLWQKTRSTARQAGTLLKIEASKRSKWPEMVWEACKWPEMVWEGSTLTWF